MSKLQLSQIRDFDLIHREAAYGFSRYLLNPLWFMNSQILSIHV